jgi:HTH-type transcriptional regulator/antitoxin HigA
MATTIDGHMHTALNGDIEEYLALVRSFPLAHIRDDAHCDAAMATLWPLLEKREKSRADEEYIAALTDLVETYENATVAIPPPRSGLDMLRYLVEENGYTQAELTPIFGTQSVASAVLTGARTFTLDYMRKAAAFFGLPLSVFTGD